MTNANFIAGDWGTSNLRLYLCRYTNKETQIVDTKFGPGISQINGDFEDRFFNLCDPWFSEHGNLPVLLSGMVGSNIGWKEVPYLNCPLSVEELASACLTFNVRGVPLSILGGARTKNPLGNPDVMRGEELQILGWMKRQTAPVNNQLFALPGTHNKWTLVKDEKISNFVTAFTGELFSLLRTHSILIAEQTTFNFNQDVFLQGVTACQQSGDANLIHLLFATRSKQVVGEMAQSDTLSYLSGLIIAADIFGALQIFGDQSSVVVIGENSLADHYAMVLELANVECHRCDPADIAISGFESIYQALYDQQ